MNWDNPISFSEFDDSIHPLNARHGVSYIASEWANLIGWDYDKLGYTSEAYYRAYLTYCKIMNSALGKALC